MAHGTKTIAPLGGEGGIGGQGWGGPVLRHGLGRAGGQHGPQGRLQGAAVREEVRCEVLQPGGEPLVAAAGGTVARL